MRLVLCRRAALAAAAAVVLPARAELPAGPIRLVVGFAPGGGIDAFARIVARAVQANTGRAVVVENRPGAGGTVAAAHVARAAPDGTTLLVGENGVIAIAPALYPQLPYDPQRDLVPVLLGVSQTVVLLAQPGLATDTAGLIARARAEPGRLTYSSAGSGNPTHLIAADFCARAGIEATHVSYRGGGQMVTSLLARETHFGFFGLASALPHVRSGAAVALGVCDEAPHPLLPGVPTVAATVPGFAADFWYGFNAPAGTSAPVVAALGSALAAGLAAAEAREVMAAQGLRVVAADAAAYARFAAAEAARWGAVVRSSGARVE
jgi:tripartite-type tricarboxylate transporter receptor subunit TctC